MAEALPDTGEPVVSPEIRPVSAMGIVEPGRLLVIVVARGLTTVEDA